MEDFFKYTLFAIALSLPSLPNASAQGSAAQAARQQRAVQAINDLKDGCLLVRLPSKYNKLRELERLSASKSVSEAAQKRMREQYLTTLSERDSFNARLMTAFTSQYHFSDVLFFYDTSSVQVKERKLDKLFLNAELQPELDYPDPAKPFLILRLGTTDPSVTSGIEAMVVMDAQFADLERPFPYYIKLKSLGHILEAIFSPKKRAIRSPGHLAAELNRKMMDFYKKN